MIKSIEHSSRKRMLAIAAPVLAIAVGLAAGQKTASGAGAADDQAALKERCASRLSIAFTGKSADTAALSSANPQGAVDALLASPDFAERFARFTNATMNDMPGDATEDDSAYHLSKYILTNNKPWSELFNGPYNVDLDAAKNVAVTADANGLGYFRSRPFLVRYAGNELAGIKISTAYRIQNNVLGLTLVASTNAPGADVTATGRKGQPCTQCHYDNWYALDNVASILSKRQGIGDKMTFGPQFQPSATILGGLTIHNDKELVDALVNSDAFKFRSCRLAFNFLYGRDENKCEGKVFDTCMDEFSAKKTIQSAIAAVAKDPSFCQ